MNNPSFPAFSLVSVRNLLLCLVLVVLAGCERKSVSRSLNELAQMNDAKQQAVWADEEVKGISPETLAKWQAELSQLPASNIRDIMLRAVFLKWAETSPAEAMQAMAVLQPRSSAEKMARKVADVWAKQDPLAVGQFAATLPRGIVRDRIYSAEVRARANIDPIEAFQYASTLQYDAGGSSIGIAARLLNLSSIEEAAPLLAKIKDERVRATAEGAIFDGMARKDIEGAKQYFLKISDPKAALPLSYVLGGCLSDKSLEESLEVLNQIKDPEVADAFMHGVIQRQAKKDLMPLAEKLEMVENANYREIMADSIARDMSKKDAARAIAWIAAMGNEEERARGYQGVGGGIWRGRRCGDREMAEEFATGQGPSICDLRLCLSECGQ